MTQRGENNNILYIYSLPELVDFKLFGKTILVVNTKFKLFWPVNLGSEYIYIYILYLGLSLMLQAISPNRQEVIKLIRFFLSAIHIVHICVHVNSSLPAVTGDDELIAC